MIFVIKKFIIVGKLNIDKVVIYKIIIKFPADL